MQTITIMINNANPTPPPAPIAMIASSGSGSVDLVDGVLVGEMTLVVIVVVVVVAGMLVDVDGRGISIKTNKMICCSFMLFLLPLQLSLFVGTVPGGQIHS